MSDISNRSEGNSETVQNAYMDNGRPTTPRGRPGNLLNTIRLAEDVPLGEQLSLLWKNKLFCRATMAFASSNYINAGLAFIWIRLFIQLWSMERQISTVSFLAITGGGHSCRKGLWCVGSEITRIPFSAWTALLVDLLELRQVVPSELPSAATWRRPRIFTASSSSYRKPWRLHAWVR